MGACALTLLVPTLAVFRLWRLAPAHGQDFSQRAGIDRLYMTHYNRCNRCARND
jgi:hypothetical protein